MGRVQDDELRMVEECVEVMEDVCTEWECAFLLSIREQLEGRGTLTRKQADVLDRVYKKACASSY